MRLTKSRVVGAQIYETVNDPTFYAARVSYSISLLLFYIRVIYIASVTRTLGSTLKMISKMITRDMLPFMLILGIFLLSFGVTTQALLFPNGLTSKNGTIGDGTSLLWMWDFSFYAMVY